MPCSRPRVRRESDRLPVLAVQVRRADLLDLGAIDALVEAVRPSHLLHFAWIATPGVYWQSAENHRWLAASQTLLRSFQLRGGVRAVMAGSCAEYDWSRAGVCNEATSPLAQGAESRPYAACKIALQRRLDEFAARTACRAPGGGFSSSTDPASRGSGWWRR